MSRVGILGGVGPLASCYLYERIIKNTKASIDQEHVNLIINSHAEIPNRTDYLLDNTKDNPLPVIEKDLKELENLGVDFIVMNCNTAHSFYDELASSISIPLLNIIKLTVESIDNKNKIIGVMATDGTNKGELYQKELISNGFTPITPPENIQDMIMNIIGEVKEGKQIDEDYFLSVVQYFKDSSCDKIILGCTELSVLREEYKLDDYYIDPIEVISKEIISRSGKQLI